MSICLVGLNQKSEFDLYAKIKQSPNVKSLKRRWCVSLKNNIQVCKWYMISLRRRKRPIGVIPISGIISTYHLLVFYWVVDK